MEARTVRSDMSAAGEAQPEGPLSGRVGQLAAALAGLDQATDQLEVGLSPVLAAQPPATGPAHAISEAPRPPSCELDERVFCAVEQIRRLERRVRDMYQRCQL